MYKENEIKMHLIFLIVIKFSCFKSYLAFIILSPSIACFVDVRFELGKPEQVRVLYNTTVGEFNLHRIGTNTFTGKLKHKVSW